MSDVKMAAVSKMQQIRFPDTQAHYCLLCLRGILLSIVVKNFITMTSKGGGRGKEEDVKKRGGKRTEGPVKNVKPRALKVEFDPAFHRTTIFGIDLYIL